MLLVNNAVSILVNGTDFFLVSDFEFTSLATLVCEFYYILNYRLRIVPYELHLEKYKLQVYY